MEKIQCRELESGLKTKNHRFDLHRGKVKSKADFLSYNNVGEKT